MVRDGFPIKSAITTGITCPDFLGTMYNGEDQMLEEGWNHVEIVLQWKKKFVCISSTLYN